MIQQVGWTYGCVFGIGDMNLVCGCPMIILGDTLNKQPILASTKMRLPIA